jgi:hypothetical protein
LSGMALCGRCRAFLVRLIAEIRDAWPIVATRIQPVRRERLDSHPTPFGPSSPANDFVLSLTDWRTTIPEDERDPVSVPAAVAGWMDTVKAERGTATDGRPAAVLSGLAYLTVHVDHLAAAPWAADVVDELAAVARHLRRVVGADRPPLTARACPGDEGQGCPGKLRPDAGAAQMLGRLTRDHTVKKGQPPWILSAPSEADIATAEAWSAAQSSTAEPSSNAATVPPSQPSTASRVAVAPSPTATSEAPF